MRHLIYLIKDNWYFEIILKTPVLLLHCLYHIVLDHFTSVIKDILRILTRENTPSNETEALTKSKKMNIWSSGTSNQIFVRSS